MNTTTQPKLKVVEHPQLDESTGFDYRVHIKDAKTGKLVRLQHYARHSRGNEVLLERPVGSGNCFTENGQAAGRWDLKAWQKISDQHIEVAPMPANRTEELEQQNAALSRELEALRAEAAAGLQAAAKTVQKK